MIPFKCQVKHDPENGTYGDCFRACVASILELDPDQVPHFCENGETINNNERLDAFLASHRLAMFTQLIDGDPTREQVLEHVGMLNPSVPYMLCGTDGETDHIVVCKGSRVVNNPAWIPQPIVGPNSQGFWVIMVLARL